MAVPLLIPLQQAITDATVDMVSVQIPAAANRAVEDFFATLPTTNPTEPNTIWNRNGVLFIGPTDPEEPDAFTSGDWSLIPGPGEGQLTVLIHELPYHNGATITQVLYSLDGDPADPAPTPGSFVISGLDYETTVTVQLWAVNAVGTSPAGDIKSATPAAPGAFTSSLNFGDERNSQFVPLLF